MNVERHVKLFRNGRNQAIRIPREYEMPGSDALIRKEGRQLVIVPAETKSILSLLSQWEPLDIDFPDIDENMLSLDDVTL